MRNADGIIISLIAYSLLLINILLALRSHLRQDKAVFWFNGFQILGLLTQISAGVLMMLKQPNLPLLHLYTLLEFVFLSMFYASLLKEWIWVKKYAIVFTVAVSSLIILNTLFLQPISGFNNNAKTLTQLLYLAYSASYFFQAHNTQYSKMLHTINAGIMLYYAGSLFIFMFSNVLFEQVSLYRIFWVINASLYLLFQIILFIALWRNRITKSSYS